MRVNVKEDKNEKAVELMYGHAYSAFRKFDYMPVVLIVGDADGEVIVLSNDGQIFLSIHSKANVYLHYSIVNDVTAGLTIDVSF